MRSSTSRRRTKPGRRSGAFDNVVLDLRTSWRLGRLLWRPMLAELWSRRARVRPLGHR
jgi:hypothetical protein